MPAFWHIAIRGEILFWGARKYYSPCSRREPTWL